MNEEFSGRGRGRELGRIGGWDTGRGLGHWEGFGRWEKKGRVMGVLKGWKAGEIWENYPALLCNRKMAK